MKRETRWLIAGFTATALGVALAAPLQAEAIFQDDFEDGSVELETPETPNIGLVYGRVPASPFPARQDGGIAYVEAASDREVTANATRAVITGEDLVLTFDMLLIDNDSGSTYEFDIGLRHGDIDRTVGFRLTYPTSATTANLLREWAPGGYTDTGIDVAAVNSGFETYTLTYAQGAPTFTLSIDDGDTGTPILAPTSFAAVEPTELVTGIRFFAGGSSTRARIDNLTLTVLDSTVITTNLVEDTFALGFDSAVGFTYELQSTELPQSNNWITTGATIEGTDGPLLMFDPTGFSTSKLYRVVKF